MLSGPLLDQAVLHGVLLHIICLGYTLHSIETSKATGHEETAKPEPDSALQSEIEVVI